MGEEQGPYTRFLQVGCRWSSSVGEWTMKSGSFAVPASHSSCIFFTKPDSRQLVESKKKITCIPTIDQKLRYVNRVIYHPIARKKISKILQMHR